MITVKSDIIEQDSMLRYENDTFEIVYNLFEENGLLSFSIYNKSDKPLYVDWKRSAFIQGEQRAVYWENTSTFYSVTTGSTVNWLRDYSTSMSHTFGMVTTPEQVAFIPPKTAIGMAHFKLGNTVWFEGLEEDSTYKKRRRSSSFKSKKYESSNSPSVFRNFLTLSLNHKFNTEFYIDHSFWVSKVTHLNEKEFILITNDLDNSGGFIFIYPFEKPNVYYNFLH